MIQKKKFLKKVYQDFYRRFEAAGRGVPAGPRVEIGSGGGFIKEILPDVMTSDVVPIQNLTDMTFSALQMPFEDDSVSTFFLLNTMHHLPDAAVFLAECQRCLKPGGRIIMIEPAGTPWGRFIYKHFHHEPFDERAGWTAGGGRLSGGNQAIPWIVFVRDRDRFSASYPMLRTTSIEVHSPFRYLLSGGLKHPIACPGALYGAVHSAEILLSPMRGLLGMFMTVVVEKVK